jgi:hypothetical protein
MSPTSDTDPPDVTLQESQADAFDGAAEDQEWAVPELRQRGRTPYGLTKAAATAPAKDPPTLFACRIW